MTWELFLVFSVYQWAYTKGQIQPANHNQDTALGLKYSIEISGSKPAELSSETVWQKELYGTSSYAYKLANHCVF